MKQVLIIATIVLCLFQAVASMSIEVKPHDQACFYELLNIGDKLTVTFQVSENENPDINFWITDPNGQKMMSMTESSGSHSIQANLVGRYTYCFANLASSTGKSINFNVHDVEKIHQSAQAGIDPLEEVIRELEESIAAVKDEQEYLIARERVHRGTAEDTNSRVKWWSTGQLILLVLVCFFQVYYLRRFFEVKRIV